MSDAVVIQPQKSNRHRVRPGRPSEHDRLQAPRVLADATYDDQGRIAYNGRWLFDKNGLTYYSYNGRLASP